MGALLLRFKVHTDTFADCFPYILAHARTVDTRPLLRLRGLGMRLLVAIPFIIHFAIYLQPRQRHSTGKMKGATNYACPQSRILDQIDGMIPVSKVVVLYCKDTGMHLLREPYQRTPQQFCDEVQLLADVLNSCGGIYCHFDGYDSVCVDNWSLWVQKTIEESDFVLTVCSPMLYQVLRDSRHKLVDMLRGKFYPDVIVNYISPHKFIPVFLDMPARDEWVPVNLQTSTYYELYVSNFAIAMGDTDGLHPLAFEKKMSALFDDPKFEKIASLIATLRKQSVNPRPLPPPRLIHPVIFGRPLFKAVIRPEDENPNVILGEGEYLWLCTGMLQC